MVSKVAKKKCSIKEVVKEESMTRRDDDDDEDEKDEKSDKSTLPSSPSFAPCDFAMFPSHRPHTKFGRNDDVCNRTFWYRFISKRFLARLGAP